MSRPRKSIPAIQHHKASGQAKVRIRGKDFYLGRWNSQEAAEAYSRIVAESAVAGPTAIQAAQAVAKGEGLSVAELCAAWLEYAEKTYLRDGKPTSVIERFKTPIRCVRKLYGLTPAAQFGPLALEAVRGEFVKLGFSRGICNAYAGNVRRLFCWGVSRELIPATVATALSTLEPLKAGRTKAPESKRVPPIADATVSATLPHLPLVVADMVRLQLATGMRPGEICMLRPGDIDRTGEVWRFQPAQHKTAHHGKERIIWIGPQGQAILTKYLLRATDAFCFSPREAVAQVRRARHEARKTPLSCGNRPGSKPSKRKPVRSAGDCYTNSTYRRAIERACEVAFAMPDKLAREQQYQWRAKHCWRPNQLRHRFACKAREVGGIESVQALLGHSSIGTSQIYADRLNALAESVAAKIG